ncbi:MAG: hypothetical protein RBR69_10215 [Candidatus Cloacimonadaceae bacterium]|nr:hypothetical protein [Candidatus Cloacimonadaceae bacterium]
MTIPLSLSIFVLGIIVSLISYIWASHAKKIERLARKVECLEGDAREIEKFKECEPITMQQITALFDARFNEFRLELYKSGVLKAPSNRHKKVES